MRVSCTVRGIVTRDMAGKLTVARYISRVAEPPRFVEVALPLPLFQTFTYAVDGVQGPVAKHLVPGARVVVPFRSGRAIGICLGTTDTPPPRGVAKPIIDVPDTEPAVTPALLGLCRWMAEYYVVPLGIALRSALPALLTGAAAPAPAPKTRRTAVLRETVPSLIQRTRLFARSPKQRALYELLESLGGRASAAHLLQLLNCTPSVLARLAERGLIDIEDQVVERDPFAARSPPSAPAHTPTAAQQAALEALSVAGPGEVSLLHGVTGSGKTLVYVDFLREVVDRRGQTAIVLVPEIALTPQTVDRFRAVFGDRVAVLHSALSDGERYDAWRALRSGVKRIAVGARSAVFAPLEQLGAIIVDEEHEASYKQGEAPRYHAREVALVRAQHAGAVVVLGSATPSLESWSNARAGKYRLLTLPDRVGGARLPSVEVVDLRQPPGSGVPTPGAAGMPTAYDPFRAAVSEPLERALRETMARHEQSILLLNRRGYAAFVQCPACGDVAVCPNCSISLTYHRTPEQLVCHYCRHHEPSRTTCVRCGEATLRRRGLGTQQLERLVAERFPDARVARMDVDTTGAKWAHAHILDRVGRGEVDILLGTQMIAKGHDIPNVTLVGVVSADVGLGVPDFRAAERTFQLLTQVAGRAGRGAVPGIVLIQTINPDHYAVRIAAAQDYQAFYEKELAFRRMMRYPPFSAMANVLVRSEKKEMAMRLSSELGILLTPPPEKLRVMGPAEAPVARVKNEYRYQFLIKAASRTALNELLQRIRSFALERKWGATALVIDVDPLSLT